MNKEQYPIGKFNCPSPIRKEHLNIWKTTLSEFPGRLKSHVSSLTDKQLDTQYRVAGWTIRQVVHHCADSHHNSYSRFKWALTEDKPIIKAYFEERWAELDDSKCGDIKLALDYLVILHARWLVLLENLNESELNRTFIHPETNKEISLKENMGFYAWHCDHHYAHIYNLLKKNDWL